VASAYPGPHTSVSSWLRLSSLPGLRSSTSSRCHSVGVSLMSSAAGPLPVGTVACRVTRLAARSTIRSPSLIRGWFSAVPVRLTAARIRASSSSTPNGLVM
jgi:hypothetical protein